MLRLGLEPWAAGWLVQTNPLSYGGTQVVTSFVQYFSSNRRYYLTREFIF